MVATSRRRGRGFARGRRAGYRILSISHLAAPSWSAQHCPGSRTRPFARLPTSRPPSRRYPIRSDPTTATPITRPDATWQSSPVSAILGPCNAVSTARPIESRSKPRIDQRSVNPTPLAQFANDSIQLGCLVALAARLWDFSSVMSIGHLLRSAAECQGAGCAAGLFRSTPPGASAAFA